MKVYSTLPKVAELEPYRQMQFNVITLFLVWGGSLNPMQQIKSVYFKICWQCGGHLKIIGKYIYICFITFIKEKKSSSCPRDFPICMRSFWFLYICIWPLAMFGCCCEVLLNKALIRSFFFITLQYVTWRFPEGTFI